MRRVLVLRPEPGAGLTVARARERGLEAVAIPLFELEPLAWEAREAGGFDGVLLTSANAIRHGGGQLGKLRGLKAYAVGATTADAAREAGFDVAAAGDDGVERLLGSIEPGLELLHLCGEDRREPVDAPQRITAIPVYKAREIPAPDVGSAAGAIALIHSPRAGRRFAELVEGRGSIAVVGISEAAGAAVGTGWEAVEVAAQPTDEALLALAARLCNNPEPE